MPVDQKSAADQVAEAKAKAAGIPYVKRTWELLKDAKVESKPNKPADPPAHDESCVAQVELTEQPEVTPKASSPVSDRKKETNKANAQKSTGPRTAKGKARVSENAIKHGLCSAHNPLALPISNEPPQGDALTPGDQKTTQRTQFTQTLDDLTTSLHPANPFETQLVARLAQLTLRLNRAAQMESATLDRARAKVLHFAAKLPEDFPDPGSPDFEIHVEAETLSRASAELKLFSQCESRLSHDFARTLRQLLQIQKLRTANSLGAPNKITKQTQTVLNSKDEQPGQPSPQSLASDGQVASHVPSNTTGPQPRAGKPQDLHSSSTKPPPAPNFAQTNPTPQDQPSAPITDGPP